MPSAVRSSSSASWPWVATTSPTMFHILPLFRGPGLGSPRLSVRAAAPVVRRARTIYAAGPRGHPVRHPPRAYSFSTSRCHSRTGCPPGSSRSASAAAIATERCLPAGAADRDGEVALALGPVARQEEAAQIDEPLEERLRVRLRRARSLATRGSVPGNGFSSGTKYGFGRKRTSSTRSACVGRP